MQLKMGKKQREAIATAPIPYERPSAEPSLGNYKRYGQEQFAYAEVTDDGQTMTNIVEEKAGTSFQEIMRKDSHESFNISKSRNAQGPHGHSRKGLRTSM